MKNKKKYSVFLIVMTSMMLVLSSCRKWSESNVESSDLDESATTETQQPEEIAYIQSGIEFPYELEDGKLIVNSLFQSSIDNPDCNNEYADNIATLEVKNASDEFLQKATITVTLDNEMKIPIVITNLPAGKSVWAFATDNTTIDLDPVCEEIVCDAAFEKEMSVLVDIVSYEVDETKVTLHNLSSDNLTDLSVGCHCLFDDVYFGGLTYSYDVGELSANQSITVDADDCYLGSAEVVYITNK